MRIAMFAGSQQELWLSVSSIVVAGFVLLLRVLTLGALPLIPLSGGAHGLGMRAFRADGREREKALKVKTCATGTSRRRLSPNECLELMTAGLTLEIEQRHLAGNAVVLVDRAKLL